MITQFQWFRSTDFRNLNGKIEMLKQKSVYITSLEELREPLSESMVAANSLRTSPIFWYFSQGWNSPNFPCHGSHFAKFT